MATLLDFDVALRTRLYMLVTRMGKVVGVDINEEPLTVVRQRFPHRQFYRAAAESLTCARCEF